MAFNFKLEAVLEYRRKLEELMRKEFSEASKRLDEEKKKLAQLKDTYLRIAEELDGRKEEGLDGVELDMYYAYLNRIKEYIGEQENLVEKYKEELETKRTSLVDMSRKRRIMEIVKEKAFEVYRASLEKVEQKTLDDIATTRLIKGGDKDGKI